MFALVYTRDSRPERHLLATGDTTVGRSPVCDLVINDPSISRKHARFRVHGDHCLLTDLKGRNGTFLNGELIAEAELKPGDTITFGRFDVAFQRATEAGLSLSEHEPPLESPVTIVRSVDDPFGTETSKLTAAASRFFDLMCSIARRVVHWHSTRELMEQIVDVVFDVVPAERALLLLPEHQSPVVIPHAARDRAGNGVDASEISRAIVDRVMSQRVAILSQALLPAQPKTGPAARLPPIKRWFIAVPLWNHHESLGVLYVDSPESKPLTAADLDLVHALALYAAAAIEQARDTDKLILEAQRRRDEPPASHESPTPSKVSDPSATGRTLK